MGNPVSSGDPAESSLTPLQLASTALLHTLDGVLRVLSSGWTVAHNFPRALYHRITSEPSTNGPYLSVAIDETA